MIQLEKGSDLLPLNYNPDVLSCLANLSNDEVFTPPKIANDMLDMLPQELFRNPDAKFLDPVTKSGVFLREITKRLMAGLTGEFPDRQKRLDHILHNQVYGIAITELTSLIARRTVYCAKYPNCPLSISKFDNITGNIRFKNIQHTWKNGRCVYCGAAQSQYERGDELESHAYEFIHTDNPQEIFGNMKFDVIIGNPPYQLSDGGKGGQGSSATPIYQKFIASAKKLDPTYLAMIIPSRWYIGGKGLDDFRHEMLADRHISRLVDYTNPADCFPNVAIKGGVCYFLRDCLQEGKCKITTLTANTIQNSERFLLEEGSDVFIRWNEGISIFNKTVKGEKIFFDSVVSPRMPFGLSSTFSDFVSRPSKTTYKIYANKSISYVDKTRILRGQESIDKYKIFISFAYGAGEDFPHQIINKPFIGEPGSCCTETYLMVGPFKSKNEAANALSYMATKFFRFMVLLRKSTQNATAKVYSFVPMQDFSKPWTDAELYKKYGLDENEINFIESMIKPMELPAEAKHG